MPGPDILRHPARFLLLGLVSGTILILDQATKTIIQNRMSLHESIPVIPSFFNLTYIRNPGAAFGLFAEMDDRFRFTFFIIIALAALLFLTHLYIKLPAESLLGRLSISLIIGGALGNLVDRVRYGEVVDFLDFFIGDLHWPAFNIADSAITVGVTMMVLYFFRMGKLPPEDPA